MKRRTFIATAGLTSLAGCARLSPRSADRETSKSASETETGTPESDTETEAPGREYRTTAIADLQTSGLTYALTPATYRTADGGEVGMEFTQTATADHPLTLSVTLTNGNDFSNTFRLATTPPFDDRTSRIPHPFGEPYANVENTYRVSLVLAPTANHELVEDAPDVELTDDGTWRLTNGVSPWLPEQVTLGAGETIRGEYVVVGRRDGVDAGRPPGVYEFRSYDQDQSLAVWETDAPGPEGESRFSGVAVPPIREDSSTAWYHDADQTASSYLEPSTERGTLPEQVRFTIVNKSREKLQCGHWDLYKLVDGEWFHLGPYFQTSDCRILRPGSAKRWTLNAYEGEALPPRDSDKPGMNVGFLGGGQYGIVAGYSDSANRSAAIVELTGDPVSVIPTEDVTSERSGRQVVVTRVSSVEDGRTDGGDAETDGGTGGSEHPPSTKLILTPAESATHRLLPEQVMRERNRGLRNTLAFVDDDVDQVILRTEERVADQAIGFRDDVRRFSFEGAAYEARIERKSM